MSEPAQRGHSERQECTCDPEVWVYDHRNETLIAWQWPDQPMMLQPVGGVAVTVTSEQFETTVRDTWTPIAVGPDLPTVTHIGVDGATTIALVQR